MNALLKVHEDILASVGGATKPRAVKVVVDAGAGALVVAKTFPAGPSLAEDFGALPEALEDGIPCLMLVRLSDDAGTLPGAKDADWAMVAWTPDGAPVKLRMLCASSRKTLHDALSGVSLKEYPVTEREDVSFQHFREATRELTQTERRQAMSLEEQVVEDVREECRKEQSAAPKMLLGLAAVSIAAEA